MTDNSSPGKAELPPFLIRVEHLDTDKQGFFRPAASVRFAASLRTSGLLAALPPEAVRDLLMLLTFISPNGICSPHIEQLAEAMGVPVSKARNRFERLAGVRFRGQKIIAGKQRDNGLEIYSPLPWLAPVREDAIANRRDEVHPVLYAAPRQAVIDHSRATYARPRAEVEREVERQLRRPYPSDTSDSKSRDASSENEALPQPDHDTGEKAEVRKLLTGVGLLPEQVEALLERHDLLSIRRQLAWLPYRGAKNPVGLLMAAVKDNYEAPPVLRPLPPTESPSCRQELGELNRDAEIDVQIPLPPDTGKLTPS